jgi:heterodisulfide reductase subunit C
VEDYEISYEKVQKNAFIKKIELLSGQNVYQCYQCGKCSAVCPMAEDMDYLPNQIMKLLQMGDDKTLSSSQSPWICSSCLGCSARCPKGVRIAEIMEALRIIELRKRNDFWDIVKSRTDLDDLPPIAVIANFRKLTG